MRFGASICPGQRWGWGVTRWKGEGSVCFTHKYCCVLTANTTHNTSLRLVSGPGVIRAAHSLSARAHTQDIFTDIWICDKVVQLSTRQTLTASCSEKVSTRKEAQPCLSSCLLSSSGRCSNSSSSSLLAGKLACPVFFCLIWSQEWLSKKERHSRLGGGGVVYCSWRKRCRVTSCT